METYALIGHYLSLKHFGQMAGWPRKLIQFLPAQSQKEIIRHLPPYQLLKLPRIISATGSAADGFVFIAPILPEHAIMLPEGDVLKKIASACRMAEAAGVHIASLAGYTSVVGNEGEAVSAMVNLAVTSGNTFTAALALRGLRKAAQLMHVEWKSACVAVIGASGDIGSACVRVLGSEVRKLVLVARRQRAVEELAASLRGRVCAEIIVVKYVKDALRNADLVLSATSALTTIIEPNDLKSGAIVCDVALPHSVGIDAVRQRRDVLVFEGGMARLPRPMLSNDKRLSIISEDGVTVFGCLAEAMLLALEGRVENFSIGRGRITPERINEMERLAAIHGFEVSGFRYNGLVYDDGMIDRIRQLRTGSS